MLALLKIFLNIVVADTTQDDLLNALLSSATADFEDTTGTEYNEADSNMKDIIVQMAIVKYHRLGVEGTTSQSFSSASETYSEGYPKELNRRIIKYKKVRMK